jgi:hypothetical protein
MWIDATRWTLEAKLRTPALAWVPSCKGSDGPLPVHHARLVQPRGMQANLTRPATTTETHVRSDMAVATLL